MGREKWSESVRFEQIIYHKNGSKRCSKGNESRDTAGLDGCAIECLKSDGTSVIEWLVLLLNVYFMTRMVPANWTSAWLVTLYKGKDNKYESVIFKGISLLIEVG